MVRMTKKELERRIVALEAQVAMLSRQVAQQPPSAPWFPNPNPFVYPQITCDVRS